MDDAALPNLCYMCLSDDVAVKLILPNGIERYLCAEDWADRRELKERLVRLLSGRLGAPDVPSGDGGEA